jgi:hypothetical protein
LQEYDSSTGGFNPPIQAPRPHPLDKLRPANDDIFIRVAMDSDVRSRVLGAAEMAKIPDFTPHFRPLANGVGAAKVTAGKKKSKGVTA